MEKGAEQDPFERLQEMQTLTEAKWREVLNTNGFGAYCGRASVTVSPSAPREPMVLTLKCDFSLDERDKLGRDPEAVKAHLNRLFMEFARDHGFRGFSFSIVKGSREDRELEAFKARFNKKLEGGDQK